MSSIHNFGKNGNNSNGGTPNGAFPGGGTAPQQKTLDDEILIDYIEKAKNNEFTTALFRDTQIKQTIDILSTLYRPNALIIGDAGVGKTQIVEEIANRLAKKDPLTTKRLGEYKIMELPISKLVAGKSYVGQLEEAVNQIIDYASNPKNKVILFIDEIHQILSKNDTVNDKIAQILKPAMGRADMHIIGATTTQEALEIQNDPAFARRWSTVIVPELSPAQTVEILKGRRSDLAIKHQITMPDNLLEEAVMIGDQYKQYGSHRPDTAITLVDRAMSSLRTDTEKLAITAQQALAQVSAANATLPTPVLTANHLKKTALTLITGKENTMNNNHIKLQQQLDENIIGQKSAKNVLIDTTKRSAINIVKSKRPNSFLFFGPSGTGKTEIAKQLAKCMFNSDDAMITIHMNELTHASSINTIIGSPPGFVGSNSKRELPFDKLRSNPFQLILLDEYEKADREVQNLFMQILDEGKLKTNRGDTIDFTRATIIATTNAGVSELNEKTVGFGNNGQTKAMNASDEEMTQALKKYLAPELLNRFTHKVLFKPLSLDEYTQVLAVKYNQIIKEATENRTDIELKPESIDIATATTIDKLNDLAKKSYNQEFNGRPAEKTMQSYIENQLLANPNKVQHQLL